MQYELLKFLRCPITKTELIFKPISTVEKIYADGIVTEVNEGLLFSEAGFVFPIIKGIPRMLIESVYDYADFLMKHLDEYTVLKQQLEGKYPGLLNYCTNKNRKTKKSFDFEWSFLNKEKDDKIWHDTINNLGNVFMNEIGKEASFFKDKIILDAGSGHGVMTAQIAKLSGLAIGVELSNAVENAYQKNAQSNAWYVQGDLQFLPFKEEVFDIVYSSGVIHHTNNTELSLSLLQTFLKKDGILCLWLYHPQKSLLHNASLIVRKVTSKLPLMLTFYLLAIIVFPVTYLIKKLKNKNAPNAREEMIDLLDAFTPEFRFEIPHDVAIAWLQYRSYKNINIASKDQFGFAITGEK